MNLAARIAVILGAATATGTSSAAAATPVPPAPARSARVQGEFQMIGRVTAAVGLPSEHVGETVHRAWTFVSLCPTGQCSAVRIVRTRATGADTLLLRRTGLGVYAGTGSFYAPLRCAGRNHAHGELVPFTITVRVIAAATVNGAVLATGLTASYVNRSRTNLTACVAEPAHDAATYRGLLVTPATPATRVSGSRQRPTGPPRSGSGQTRRPRHPFPQRPIAWGKLNT